MQSEKIESGETTRENVASQKNPTKTLGLRFDQRPTGPFPLANQGSSEGRGPLSVDGGQLSRGSEGSTAGSPHG